MAQYSLNPDRCQRATVSGRTIKSAFFHRAQNRQATTQKSLSMTPSLGLGCWRLKTASCWRRARFSSIRLRRVRNPRSTAPSQSRNRSNMATNVIADRLAGCPAKLLISQPDRIVTRDRLKRRGLQARLVSSDCLAAKMSFLTLRVLVATDFFTVEVLTLSGLITYYVLFFIHLESRRKMCIRDSGAAMDHRIQLAASPYWARHARPDSG